ncbi:hypothetical protein RKE29_02875 [Streptomyces sp. B1866]|uniref:hypothetical protein n=1 Tax=Streptomyces sp. B1866 TaxID=3075431 RepID=UPI00288F5197|nr:hypothetical protein [Streptomyces sp. B1866]MDT3395603.1 hypothetical protein [Streptomyces sp. B1866]
MTTGVPAVDLAAVWSAVVAAVGGALALLYRATRTARHLAERLGDLTDDWTGTPQRPGVPARPGVMTRLARIEERLAAVEHELHPNAGNSLRDAVDRVEARARQLADRPPDR